MSIKNSIIDLLNNYTRCQYPLSVDQIHHMLPKVISQKELEKTLTEMEKEGKIIRDDGKQWYTISGHGHLFRTRMDRKKEMIRKNATISQFYKIVSLFPGVKFVGLTGSCALDNADYSDDIDVMIITSSGKLFIYRLLISLCVFLIGKRRKRGESTHPDAVCINIWIDESDMLVPPQKQTVYGAREIINMIPILNRDQTYERFLLINRWVATLVPNCNITTDVKHAPDHKKRAFVFVINDLLAKAQLKYMKPHITNEIVSKTQLWLHPKIRG